MLFCLREMQFMDRLLGTTLVFAIVATAVRADSHLQQPKDYSQEEFFKITSLPADTLTLDDKQKKTVEIGVRWNMYKITSPTVHATPGEMNKVITACEFVINNYFRKDKDRFIAPKIARTEFIEQLIAAVSGKDTIMDNTEQPNITLINTARVLAYAAEMSGDEKLLAYLTDLVATPDRIDAVRYWALKGMSGVLEHVNKQAPPGLQDAALRKKVQSTAIAFITRKSPLLPKAPQEEIEGLRVVRREAVRVLALTRDPGTMKDNPVAVTLARVASNDGLDPTTRLDERVEAAIGLMSLDPKNNSYDITAAAVHVGYFLNYFNAEYAVRKGTPREPWKIHAARLSDALQQWKASNDPFVKDLIREGTVLLKDYEDGRAPKPQVFSAILKKDSAGEIYKNDKTSEVKIGQ